MQTTNDFGGRILANVLKLFAADQSMDHRLIEHPGELVQDETQELAL
jgi:hypothetical protein